VSTSGLDLARRRGEYGLDAPSVPALLGTGGLALTALGLFGSRRAASPWPLLPLLGGAALLLSTASYLYTTRMGKFAVWAELLRSLELRGDERILDLGCGRGAVLLMAAALLPRGRAVGVDLWQASDQSGNSPDATRRNAEAEGVAERVEVRTADLRRLPFPDGSFDVVLSSLAVHNIHDPAGRAEAIDEAVRVLKPGGRVLLVDILATEEYRERLRRLGLGGIGHRRLGWRFWYGGPWVASTVVAATKSA
jgi:arsenite methyltransferase